MSINWQAVSKLTEKLIYSTVKSPSKQLKYFARSINHCLWHFPPHPPALFSQFIWFVNFNENSSELKHRKTVSNYLQTPTKHPKDLKDPNNQRASIQTTFIFNQQLGEFSTIRIQFIFYTFSGKLSKLSKFKQQPTQSQKASAWI